MRQLRRWIRGLKPDRLDQAVELDLDLDRLIEEVEDGLRSIDFEEVTDEDRATFVERAVVWQVRRALNAGAFDLALELQQFGVRRIAALDATRVRWRPQVLDGGSAFRPQTQHE